MKFTNYVWRTLKSYPIQAFSIAYLIFILVLLLNSLSIFKDTEEQAKKIMDAEDASRKVGILNDLMAGKEIKLNKYPYLYSITVKPRLSQSLPVSTQASSSFTTSTAYGYSNTMRQAVVVNDRTLWLRDKGMEEWKKIVLSPNFRFSSLALGRRYWKNNFGLPPLLLDSSEELTNNVLYIDEKGEARYLWVPKGEGFTQFYSFISGLRSGFLETFSNYYVQWDGGKLQYGVAGNKDMIETEEHIFEIEQIIDVAAGDAHSWVLTRDTASLLHIYRVSFNAKTGLFNVQPFHNDELDTTTVDKANILILGDRPMVMAIKDSTFLFKSETFSSPLVRKTYATISFRHSPAFLINEPLPLQSFGGDAWISLSEISKTRGGMLHLRKTENGFTDTLLQASESFSSGSFQLSDNKITFLTKNSQGYSLKHLTDKLTQANGDDSIVLSQFKRAEVILPPYAEMFHFFANYQQGLAVVHVTQDEEGKYQYDFVTKTIQWPENAFEAIVNPDVFVIIVLAIALLIGYLICYIFIHSYISAPSITSSNPIFDTIPSLKEKLFKLERDTRLLKGRSDRMLGLGVFFGGLGVCFSIIMFKMADFNISTWDDPRTIIGILRPAVLLIFVEIFTFFFLKQYRIIFNEYKLFYSLYLKILNYFHLLEINGEPEKKEALLAKLNEAMLNEKYELYEGNTKAVINEFDNSTAIQKLIEALKNK